MAQLRKTDKMTKDQRTPEEEIADPRPSGEGEDFPEAEAPLSETEAPLSKGEGEKAVEEPEKGTAAEDPLRDEGSAQGEVEEASFDEDADAASPEAILQRELDALQEEMDRLKDQHLRLAADFENYRKRVSGELAGGWVRARADLVASLVDGLDDLQRVSKFTSEDSTVDTLVEGVDLVERKLLKALTDAGLEVFDPVGAVFDPNSMEAMMRAPVEEEGQDGTVQMVLQKGYMFKDQLVRPARVSVHMDDD
jgi:molecular chaperone GrpE